MDGYAELRRMMVDCQLRTYDVTDRGVLAATDAVPREAFLPQALAHLAYLDQTVAIPGTGRALMTPMVIARMIQTLAVQAGETVLEYAGGTGYGAALMAHMGAKATLWETDAAAREQAVAALARAGEPVTVTGDRPSDSAFDAILVSGSCEVIPDTLAGLLREGGRLVVVQGVGRAARVTLYTKAGGALSGRPVFDAAAPVLPEFQRPTAFVL